MSYAENVNHDPSDHTKTQTPGLQETKHRQSYTHRMSYREEVRPAMKKKMTKSAPVKKKVHQGVWLPLHAGDSHDMRWSQLFTLTPLRLKRPCSSASSSSSRCYNHHYHYISHRYHVSAPAQGLALVCENRQALYRPTAAHLHDQLSTSLSITVVSAQPQLLDR